MFYSQADPESYGALARSCSLGVRAPGTGWPGACAAGFDSQARASGIPAGQTARTDGLPFRAWFKSG